MENYAAKISFVGTHFHGWQIQPNAISVQGEIENALQTLFQEKIDVIGCGRTDAGVHASDFVLNFHAPDKYEPSKLRFKLNGLLGDFIAFHKIQTVAQDFHSRFDATERSYQYFCHLEKAPFLLNRSMHLRRIPDIDLMNQAAQLFLGKKDFESLARTKSGVDHFICEVTRAEWSWIDNNRLVFDVSANRFLRNMVRAMVGTLLQVGYRKIPPYAIEDILNAKKRSAAGESVKACGLYLSKIKYPNITWQQQKQ
ncbi:tRNA pseudouridine(38-40) synthase TruA [Luteibaculum oceani]|uniref:tRNA pseudouridine synthase A n=1 Tax=Luteibaculum oceani TaxID=1294296 RepID=A0A5C6V8G4_9FLAO|nr:tRNA pseudouridine(38-40) synthase TruA [Luteibaculum oceani]TXC81319.1 tRNA pseudouridine(38-40) synthase TruA [Luteibaculum oceani]